MSTVIVSGCGADNPGEPRTPAASLMAPSADTVDGHAHVYCVEEDAVPVTVCDTWFDVSNDPPGPVLRDWWLRAVAAVRAAGTFPYEDGHWRFSSFSVEQPVAGGGTREIGWRCRGDAALGAPAQARAIDARNRSCAGGIHSLAEAQRRGCHFAGYVVCASRPAGRVDT